MKNRLLPTSKMNSATVSIRCLAPAGFSVEAEEALIKAIAEVDFLAVGKWPKRLNDELYRAHLCVLRF